MGVEQSQMLTTASVEVVSGDELQKTAAISLKEALYGKIVGTYGVASRRNGQ